jgi:3-oxoacyl-[acyl-carrier protein] reductase
LRMSGEVAGPFPGLPYYRNMNTPTNPSFAADLTNKVCLVTGGTRGIGRAIAKMLLMEGAAVAICGREQESVDAAVRELAAETGGKVAGKAADVKSHEQVGDLFQFVDVRFGGLDVLINNAGIGVFGAVGDLTLDDWKSAIETNLSGAFYCSREALFRFVTRGGGYIVNINSLAGANAFAGGSAYNASKFGLTGFTEAMMQDVRSENVRVSTVMPGSVATGFGRQSDAGTDGLDWKIWPEDVAEVVKMLVKMPTRTLVSRVEVRPAKTKSGAAKVERIVPKR